MSAGVTLQERAHFGRHLCGVAVLDDLTEQALGRGTLKGDAEGLLHVLPCLIGSHLAAHMRLHQPPGRSVECHDLSIGAAS